MTAAMLRIAVISKSDSAGGGASRVADDLTAVMNARGHRATHWCGRLTEERAATRRAYGAAVRWMQDALRAAGLLELVPVELPHMLARIRLGKYDVAHFHDLGDAFSPWTVRAVAALVPTVWTFHDCSPFTGGCLYPMDCARFVRGCGACPQLGEWPLGRFDATGASARLKRMVHAADALVTIAPCSWMTDQAIRSGRVRERPAVVPYGVDTEIFRPAADRAALRRSLGLPEDRPVLLVASMRLGERRKGVAHALRAIGRLAGMHPTVVAIGHPAEQNLDLPESVTVRQTGFISNRVEHARWVAACDVFLCCSEADNQPLAVLEAMACGVPIVGYATGGIPETVGESGALVLPGDDDGLVAALKLVLDPKAARRFGIEARRRIEAEHRMALFAERHEEVYQAAANVFGRRLPS